jgi:hydroxyacylglutathione hydrolase
MKFGRSKRMSDKSNMKIPLEDFFPDIVGKAQRGLQLDDASLGRDSRLERAQIERLKAGTGDRNEIAALATALGLAPGPLLESFENSWEPAEIALEGLAQFNTDLLGMTVNVYLVWDPSSREAAIFDAGVDADHLFGRIRAENLTVKAIFITHTHQDHVAGLAEIVSLSKAPVFAPEAESLGHSERVREGFRYMLGSLEIEARLTNGHSPGGTSYLVLGLARPVVVVGDSIFAGSMGGAPNAYEQARKNNRAKILSLPPETIICPGHGPMTTVANERAHNPFLADR